MVAVGGVGSSGHDTSSDGAQEGQREEQKRKSPYKEVGVSESYKGHVGCSSSLELLLVMRKLRRGQEVFIKCPKLLNKSIALNKFELPVVPEVEIPVLFLSSRHPHRRR